MQARSLILAALVAVAASGCETTPDAGDDAGDRNENSATATPDRNEAVTEAALHDRVHDALMEQMGPAVNDVGVSIGGTAVSLTGSVKTEADKTKAHDIAHAVRGVTSVDISALAVKP